MDKYIYDFHYFFGRKDSGSIFLAFDKELDINDQDGCIETAVAVGALDKSYAGNIDYVDEIDEYEAQEMELDVDNIPMYSI